MNIPWYTAMGSAAWGETLLRERSTRARCKEMYAPGNTGRLMPRAELETSNKLSMTVAMGAPKQVCPSCYPGSFATSYPYTAFHMRQGIEKSRMRDADERKERLIEYQKRLLKIGVTTNVPRAQISQVPLPGSWRPKTAMPPGSAPQIRSRPGTSQ